MSHKSPVQSKQNTKPQSKNVKSSPTRAQNLPKIFFQNAKLAFKKTPQAPPKVVQPKDTTQVIYKRCESPPKNESAKQVHSRDQFQKVTQELASIIKNFQQQIHDVPIVKTQMEQIPSAMIQPKTKEFFKTQKSEEKKNDTGKSVAQKSSICKKESKQVSGISISKPSSARNTSVGSNPNLVRRFNSFTTHALTPTHGSRNHLSNRSNSYIDPLKQLKDEVAKAIRDKKTFTVRGHFAPIRKALLDRNWVEKYHISHKDQLTEDLKKYLNYSIAELLPLLRKEDLTQTCKNIIKSKLLGGYQVDFYWGVSEDAFKENPDKIKYTIINRLKRDIFSYTNKQGLCDASKSCYWFQKQKVSKLNHPRSYSLGKNGDQKGFVEDFQITAAMSLLKWIVEMNETKECKLISPCGKIPLETFDFALNECCKFIKKGRHEDIDVQIPEATEFEWNQFLDFFYKLVHYNNHFKCEMSETDDSLVRKSNYILNNLRNFYPFVDMDGLMNIWILKPTASSRGRGIHMCRTLQYILKVTKQNPNIRYVIQKYIERPLLIYKTKFDIRQWFLISNCAPLTIWMYKESYLRFSSQTYNLRKLHESIHLTNNSVQCKYKTNSIDTALPSYNMWDSNEFQKYLCNIGYPDAFHKTIYPGMQQCITAAVLMHHDKMVVRKNCFELYGADFMLTEDFQPWLLEINSNPALFASTPVTARMCPKVLQDVIKVVVDYGHNAKASTGLFELIYREKMAKLPVTADFEVKGVPLRTSYFSDIPAINVDSQVEVQKAQDSLRAFGEEIKKTLKDLLQIIHHEKAKRAMARNVNGEV